MSEKIKMPTPAKVAITKAINAIVKMKRPSAEDLQKKEVLTAVLKSAGNLSFRFQALPDEARQAIRNSVVADCKAMTYGSMTACAIEYGITPPNLTKWLREDRQGIKDIRVVVARTARKTNGATWKTRKEIQFLFLSCPRKKRFALSKSRSRSRRLAQSRRLANWQPQQLRSRRLERSKRSGWL